MTGSRAVEVRIAGEVQGVGFRWYAAREATRLGLVGWVRNEADGSVRGHLEGEDADVATMVDWCRTGSPAAVVRDVDVRDVDATGGSGFVVEP